MRKTMGFTHVGKNMKVLSWRSFAAKHDGARFSQANDRQAGDSTLEKHSSPENLTDRVL